MLLFIMTLATKFQKSLFGIELGNRFEISQPISNQRPFRYSTKESESNDILTHFADF